MNIPDMNSQKASSGIPSRPADGAYRVALRKVFAHEGGLTGDLQSIVEFEILEIFSQTPTISVGYDKGVRRESPVGASVVGDRKAQKYTFRYKSTPGEWKAFLELTAAAVNEKVTDWNKYNSEIMAEDNPLDGTEFSLHVSSKTTQAGNTMAKFYWSTPEK